MRYISYFMQVYGAHPGIIADKVLNISDLATILYHTLMFQI